MNPYRHHPFLIAFLALACWGTALGRSLPESIYGQVRDSELEVARAVGVKNLMLDTGMAELILENGILYPATPLGDRAAEMVFVGKGRLVLNPPDDIEAAQLDLFTGSRQLDAHFNEAVFAVASDTASDKLLNREPAGAAAAANQERALWLYQQWKTGTIRRLAGVESSLFQDTLGDPAYGEYFAAWFRGSPLGEFYYVVDPTASEQVSVGQFVPLDLTRREQFEVSLEARFQQMQGRLIGVNTDDLGRFDTWVSTNLRDDNGKPFAGTPGLEPERYTLDIVIAKGSQRLAGRARILLKSSSGPRAAIRLTLSTDLDISKIMDAAGNQLFFVRHGSAITVPLAEPLQAGEEAELMVEYQGNPLQEIGKGSWSLRDTSLWYPHVGDLNRARYDVTFHWPRSLSLYASGQHVEGGLEDDGMRWERRVQELPISEFSFEIGDYKSTTTQVGEIAVTVAFSKEMVRRWDEEILDSVNETVVNSLEFFQETFGPLPLKELTVVPVDRNFSQGYFGFLTLSKVMLYYGKPKSPFGIKDRRTTIAHEMAHQWWGNLVGWSSYRDQWISEAMANYSAMLYSRKELNLSRTRLRGRTSGWSHALGRTTADGRTLESIGPVTLGHRLSSTKAPTAYTPIVYLKGAMIFDMLSQYFPDEDHFPILMKEIVKAAANHAISSEDFMAAVSKLTGVDMDWFTRQYIHGTGIPDIFYSYQFKEMDNGKWAIDGVARQDSRYRYRYGLVETGQGHLDVQRTKIDQQDIDDFTLIAPVQIRPVRKEDTLSQKKKKKNSEPQKRREFHGRFMLKNEETPFHFEVPEEPTVFYMDREKQVLAHFYDESYYPKGSLMSKGVRLLSDGDLQAAEQVLRQALGAKLVSSTKEVSKLARQSRQRDTERKDARTRLYLARLYLDRGQHDLAEREVMAVQKILDMRQIVSFRTWLTRTTARIEILRGEYEPAFKRLNKSLLVKDESDSTEGYLLLAIAARALGKEQVLDEAMAAAEEKGADVRLLAGNNP